MKTCPYCLNDIDLSQLEDETIICPDCLKEIDEPVDK